MLKLRCKRKMKNNYELFLTENKKDKKVLFYVLCGYKKDLYPAIFKRLDKYFDLDADVCLVTSGKFDQETLDIAKKRGWCYISTKINNISVAQNATIFSFPKAEIIIKMDEDIFVTKNTFKHLISNYQTAKAHYKKIAFVAPLLNVNGYASKRLLTLTNKLEEAEKMFGKIEYSYGPKKTLAENNIDFVKHMWNLDNKFMSIDEANELLTKKKNSFTICPIPFSIGLILFERKFWEKIGYFTTWKGNDLGADEGIMNFYAKVFHYKRIIGNNSVCGHFSFGPTNKEMMNLYKTNPKKFN